MDKTLRRLSLICLSVMLAVCLFFGISMSFVSQSNTALANEEAPAVEDVIDGNYGFKSGASIRQNLDGQGTGIKFTLQIKKAYYESLITTYESLDNLEFGVIIALNQDSMDGVTYANAIDAGVSDVQKVATNSVFTFGEKDYAERNISLVFKTNTYIYDDITVLAYVKPASADAIIADVQDFSSNTRSMAAIANYAVLQNVVELEDVSDYLGTVSALSEEQVLDKSVGGLTVDLPESFDGAKVYNGVNKISGVTVSGSTLTFANDSECGEASLAVIANGKVVNLDYVLADKVFTEENKDEIVSTFVKNSGATNSGYYILNSNIDGITINRTAKDTFSGTFNGRGYTINNVILSGTGKSGNSLFGDFDNGITVKNVAFTGVDFGSSTFSYSAQRYLLFDDPASNGIENATLENVYVSINQLTKTQLNNKASYFGGIAHVISGDTAVNQYVSTNTAIWNMNNVLVEMPVASDVVIDTDYTRQFGGSFSAVGALANSNITDTYVISSIKPLGNSNSGMYWFKNYDNKSAMEAANNDYSSFDSNWVIMDGVPVWKSYVENFAELVIKNSASEDVGENNLLLKKGDAESYTFTLALGEEVLLPTAIKLPEGCTELVVNNNVVSEGVISGDDIISVEIVYGDVISKTVEISVTASVTESALVELDATSGDIYLPEAYLSKSIVDVKYNGASVYSAGKVTGITPVINSERTDVEAITLDVEFADVSVKFNNVKPYTRIFNESNKADLISTFVSNTDTTHSGYYILNGNIDGISFERTGINIYNTRTEMDTFSGVFDGRGYTISNLGVKGAGLFGDFGNGATVKNVAFEMDFGKPSWNTYGLFYQPSGEVSSAILENIYIKAKDITEITINGSQNTLCYFSPIAKSNNVAWTIKNVITEINVGSGVTVNNSNIGALMEVEKFATSTVSNLYSITNLQVANNSSIWTIENGANKNNIKKYADRETMKAANNDYSAFVASGYWQLDSDGLPSFIKK